MHYISFDQLNGKTLEFDDRVQFGINRYQVATAHITNISGSNDQVFRDLRFKKDAELRLLDRAYGYRNTGGWWPEAKPQDYEALTRAVLVLLAFSEGSDVSLEMGDGSWVKFERKDYMQAPFVTLPSNRVVFIDLTPSYEAELTSEIAKVGCQRIPFEKVKEVYETMSRLRKEK